MDLGNKNNITIMKKYCLNGSCPKLEKGKTYEEKVSICSKCIDKVYKYDMLKIIEELLKQQETNPTLKRYTKGKGLELSDKDIERVLVLLSEEKSVNAIKEETGYSWRTISNIKNLSFKNEDNNAKIKQIKQELKGKGKL